MGVRRGVKGGVEEDGGGGGVGGEVKSQGKKEEHSR